MKPLLSYISALFLVAACELRPGAPEAEARSVLSKISARGMTLEKVERITGPPIAFSTMLPPFEGIQCRVYAIKDDAGRLVDRIEVKYVDYIVSDAARIVHNDCKASQGEYNLYHANLRYIENREFEKY